MLQSQSRLKLHLSVTAPYMLQPTRWILYVRHIARAAPLSFRLQVSRDPRSHLLLVSSFATALCSFQPHPPTPASNTSNSPPEYYTLRRAHCVYEHCITSCFDPSAACVSSSHRSHTHDHDDRTTLDRYGYERPCVRHLHDSVSTHRGNFNISTYL